MALFAVKLLIYWYHERLLCVTRDGVNSDAFPACNAIKQAGIPSLTLFNINAGVLSYQLNEVMAEWYLNGKAFK